MFYKFKRVIVVILIIFFSIPESYASASILKQNVSVDGDVTYYISNEKEFELMLNLIKTHMQTKVYVVFSGTMLPPTKNELKKYYINKTLKYHYLYQNNGLTNTNKISVYRGFDIDTITYQKNHTVTAAYSFLYYDTIEQSNYICDKINAAIKSNQSKFENDYQKAYWAYHWVIDQVNTDKSGNSFSTYNGFSNTGTACCGYSVIYCALANKLGLECRYIEGTVNNSTFNNHAWNIIKLNGNWYCIDTTWGDDDNTDKYFLKTKDEFALQEYGYHQSVLYDSYILEGDEFATEDYDSSVRSEMHPIQPSVYDIEMDVLNCNTLNVGEGYTFMINNTNQIPIDFVSKDSNIAIVDKNGVITGVGEGTTTITAYNLKFNIEQVCTITVVSGRDNPVISLKKTRLKTGKKTVIQIMNVGKNSIKCFVSSNPVIAKVDEKTGKVTAVTKGKCKITCKITNGTSVYVLSTDIIVE